MIVGNDGSGTLDPNTDAEWRDAWDAAGRLPLLIALDLKFPENDVRFWPTFVVAPFRSVNAL